jgi:F-type H+-transporting ATPase subunit b
MSAHSTSSTARIHFLARLVSLASRCVLIITNPHTMEQLIEAFGIDAKLIVVQIVNFFVLMAALSYFLYKPILKLLNEREAKIKQGITDAEEAAVAKASALEEKQAVLTQAQEEAQAIDARAQAFAKEKEAQIVATAQDKASDVIKDAEAKAQQLKAQALKESEAEIAKLAILAAEKVLKEKISYFYEKAVHQRRS